MQFIATHFLVKCMTRFLTVSYVFVKNLQSLFKECDIHQYTYTSIHRAVVPVFMFKLIFLILTLGHFFIAFGERGRERERERERDTSIGCLPHVPWPGIQPTANYVLWLGIEPLTFRCTGWYYNPLSHTVQGCSSLLIKVFICFILLQPVYCWLIYFVRFMWFIDDLPFVFFLFFYSATSIV